MDAHRFTTVTSVKAFTLLFTLLIELGLAFACGAVIVLGSVYPVTAHSCRAELVLAHGAFLLIFGSIFSRSSRISRIWHSTVAKAFNLSNTQLLV